MANSVDPDQLASQKPTDLDLHCLQKQGISGFSRTRVKGQPGKGHNHETQPAQGTKSRRYEEQPMIKQTPHIKPGQTKKNCNRGTML